jgi:NAD(P)-dependent dehydrogenase (short-subunit alcohol dehydrogenase family)
MGRLEGKVAVVTGASSGIGLASAKRFATEGAQVVITGRRQSELDAAAQIIGGDVLAVQGDVANLEDLDRLFETVRSTKGHIDVLLANAGVGAMEPLGRISEQAFDVVFSVNVKGTLFTVQKALPLMGVGGSIILTGSIAGVMGTPAFSVYSASKAAIRSLSRNWAVDLRGTGIRVNVLTPGSTKTPGLMNVLEGSGMLDNLASGLVDAIPLGRMGEAEETAAVALFLASDDSSFMTGSEVYVDGGQAQI